MPTLEQAFENALATAAGDDFASRMARKSLLASPNAQETSTRDRYPLDG